MSLTFWVLASCGLDQGGPNAPLDTSTRADDSGGDDSATDTTRDDDSGGDDSGNTVTEPPVIAYGTTVARVGFDFPALSPARIRATVPVPRGVFVDGGLTGLALRAADDSLHDAQVEVVSRYPDGSADVIEILASVPDGSPRAWTTYDVVTSELAAPPQAPFSSRAQDALPVPSEVEDLLTADVALVATDALGITYRAPLLTVHEGDADRWGPEAVRVRSHHGMTADVASPDARDPLLGVHTWVGLWANLPVVTVDLRVHNGWFGDPMARTPIQDVYVDSLRIEVPEGWTVLQDFVDPMFGASSTSGGTTTIQLVEPLGDGTFHLLPSQAKFHRRLVLVPVGSEAVGAQVLEEWIVGFAQAGNNEDGDTLWSWWNPDTARYLPQKATLPHYDFIGKDGLRVQLENDFDWIHGAMVAGTPDPASWPISSSRLGWSHPYLSSYGGMTGGSDIYFTEGAWTAYAASREGIRLHEIRFRMNDDRQPVALYDAAGDPAQLEDFLLSGAGEDYVPFQFFHYPDLEDFGIDQGQDAHILAVTSAGLQPWYEDAIRSFDAHDAQHLIRYTKDAKALVYLSNDALAKDSLWLEGELHRLSYHPYATNSSISYFSEMRNEMNHAASYPNMGIAHGRGQGWGSDALAVAYATVQDPAWRLEVRPYFDTYVALLEDAITCSGSLESQYNPGKLLDNHYARQVWEDNISQQGVLGVYEAVYRDIEGGSWNDRLESWLTAAYGSVISPVGWDTTANSPMAIAAVHSTDFATSYCTSLPSDGQSGVDGFYVPGFLARGFRLTGDPLYLERAMALFGGSESSLQGELEEMNYAHNMENEAELLSLMEELGWTVP